MARFEATTAIVAVLAGAGALAAASCSGPEAFQHSGTSSFLGGSGGRGTTAGLGGAGGGGGDGEGAIAGAAGLTGAGGDDMGAPGGGPGDSGGAAGETPGGAAGGAPLGGGGVAEGGHPAAAGGAAGGESIGAAGAGGFGGGRAMGAGGLAGAGAGGRVASGGRSGTGGAAGSGAGGAAGLGGAGGVTPPCGTCTLTIQCRNYAPADTTSMNTELWILNTGDQPIPLGMIRVRYYYTNEGGPMALEIFDKALKRTDGSGYLSVTASFSMTIGKLTKPAMDFSDIAVTGSTVLDKSVPFYFKMAIHDLNHSRLTLTNDYSNAPVAIGPCPTIVALVGNAVAGGVPPR